MIMRHRQRVHTNTTNTYVEDSAMKQADYLSEVDRYSAHNYLPLPLVLSPKSHA